MANIHLKTDYGWFGTVEMTEFLSVSVVTSFIIICGIISEYPIVGPGDEESDFDQSVSPLSKYHSDHSERGTYLTFSLTL